MRARVFHDIVVHPTQALLQPPFVLFRGGPDWPRFWTQVGARHCRFVPPIPLDLPPRRAAPVAAELARGAWCGPLTRHFGHAIASFGGRTAWSSTLPDDVPLLFSAIPGERPPGFLWAMLAHVGVAPERVRLIDRPTRVGELHVFAQAERLWGSAPATATLDLLDSFATPPPPVDARRLFVSRAGVPQGRFAGEAYLETAFAAASLLPIRPETLPLADQLALYRAADEIIFSEGSAIHALQLLGRLNARVTVVARRPGRRIASAAVGARVRALGYVDAVRGVVHGVRADGRRQVSAGISILDGARLVAGLAGQGITLAAWDPAAFAAARDADLRDWIAHRIRTRAHPADAAVARATMRRAGLDDASLAAGLWD